MNNREDRSAMRLLLVDDEVRFLKTTTRLLEQKGFQVKTATNGLEALEILHQTRIDVMVLDVKMPGMDGLEALEIVRKSHPLVSVIMLTGHATVEAAVAGLKAGAFDYVIKPIDIETLIKKIEDVRRFRPVYLSGD